MLNNIKLIIEKAWENRSLLADSQTQEAIVSVIEKLDKGALRVCEKIDTEWIVNEWIKKAILLYFLIKKIEKIEVPPFEYYDKIPLKNNYDKLNIRVVPQATARYGSYIAKGVVLMPSYINIGAYIDESTMIDTWATVGSCAQVGKEVHISGGAGIGGVLEPIQAKPVIIEDHCFIGSRSIIVEGVRVRQGAVLGANVVLTSSTKIIDVTQKNAVNTKGEIPENAIVIPGTYPKIFEAGTYQIACALIIGKRKHSTNMKTSLNDALRQFGIS